MPNLLLALAMFATPQVPVLSPGVHSLTLQGAGGQPIHYAISIPAGYPQSARVPLVLALHFAGDPRDAGVGHPRSSGSLAPGAPGVGGGSLQRYHLGRDHHQAGRETEPDADHAVLHHHYSGRCPVGAGALEHTKRNASSSRGRNSSRSLAIQKT